MIFLRFKFINKNNIFFIKKNILPYCGIILLDPKLGSEPFSNFHAIFGCKLELSFTSLIHPQKSLANENNTSIFLKFKLFCYMKITIKGTSPWAERFIGFISTIESLTKYFDF